MSSPFSNISRLLPACCALVLFASGCRTTSIKDPIIGNVYKPTNVFRAVEELPKQIKRVALLPVTPGLETQAMTFGAESLQTEVYSQLVQSAHFEVVAVQPAQIREWSGRLRVAAEDRLPPAFFKPFREELGCDAVVFCRLTVYQPYPPIRIGWNFKLVDAKDSKIWWSVDELFDAGRPDVSNAARVFSQEHAREGASIGDSQAILNSPARFARYSLQTLFGTLPKR